ncbi:hypothetical protein OIE49_36165 [Streptomyces sp. NBC_01788]|uniref:hypothetical protein n=1 Tax=Streptomyces sp. NBC_01788 TaxID=2975940 RepID=UPI002DDB693D|nr:hypothetical protein [Streptomyces sp. NBC_01788]WSB31400.1 hypothetical protein OIE49_36165 [Streptomyces sp. NBC_01788]
MLLRPRRLLRSRRRARTAWARARRAHRQSGRRGSLPHPRPAKKTAAKKPAAKKAPAAKPAAGAPADASKKEKAGPTLGELLLNILGKTPGEPHLTGEVHARLQEDHPERRTSMQTVRNTLETLGKKGLARRSTQQGSVMYSADAAAGEKAPVAAEGDKSAHAQTGEKVTADA